jgi:hypothetical protein
VLYVWLGGAALGLVAGGAVLTDLPLAVKLLVGLAVVAVGDLGPLGSVLLAGLLLGAGLLTFVVLLLTPDRQRRPRITNRSASTAVRANDPRRSQDLWASSRRQPGSGRTQPGELRLADAEDANIGVAANGDTIHVTCEATEEGARCWVRHRIAPIIDSLKRCANQVASVIDCRYPRTVFIR